MKKLIIALLTLISLSVYSNAQTAQEIVSRMEEIFEAEDESGIIMTIDTKIPILGETSAKTYSLGNKTRMDSKVMGVEFITWSDDKTTWTYIPDLNEVEITNTDSDSEDIGDDAEMFCGITDGYDISIKKETSDAWHIHCSKSKSNKDKEAPKNIDLIIAKGTYHPLRLSAKAYGISVVMRDIKIGVAEKDVTFNAADYPGVTVVDKR